MARALTTAEVRRTQLAVLRAFDTWCTDEGLRYTLAYGTLLGAVRHGGYIPWDDDVDVMMPRRDYEQMCRTGRVAGFEVWSLASDQNWPLPYAKVADPRTTVVEETREVIDIGVNIDVFPIDDVPEGALRGWLHTTTCRTFHALQVLHSLTPRAGRSTSKAVTLRLLQPAIRLVSASRLARLRTSHASRRRRWSPHAGVVVGSYPWSVPASWLVDSGRSAFEDLECRVPARAHQVLERLYGDYLELPPEDQRRTHHAYTAYTR